MQHTSFRCLQLEGLNPRLHNWINPAAAAHLQTHPASTDASGTSGEASSGKTPAGRSQEAAPRPAPLSCRHRHRCFSCFRKGLRWRKGSLSERRTGGEVVLRPCGGCLEAEGRGVWAPPASARHDNDAGWRAPMERGSGAPAGWAGAKSRLGVRGRRDDPRHALRDTGWQGAGDLRGHKLHLGHCLRVP